LVRSDVWKSLLNTVLFECSVDIFGVSFEVFLVGDVFLHEGQLHYLIKYLLWDEGLCLTRFTTWLFLGRIAFLPIKLVYHDIKYKSHVFIGKSCFPRIFFQFFLFWFCCFYLATKIHGYLLWFSVQGRYFLRLHFISRLCFIVFLLIVNS